MNEGYLFKANGSFYLCLCLSVFLCLAPSLCLYLCVCLSVLQVQDKSISETDIANIILKKFKDSGVVISFTEIARVARKEGRKTLASQLLEHESLVSDQVQMLLEMKDTDKALDKAIGSWDSQLGQLYMYRNFSFTKCVFYTIVAHTYSTGLIIVLCTYSLKNDYIFHANLIFKMNI